MPSRTHVFLGLTSASLLLFPPLLSACTGLGGDDSAFNGVSGNLGQATFSYVCIDATDSACAGSTSFSATLTPAGQGDGGQTVITGTTSSAEIPATGAEAPTFPLAIAVGSEFRMTYGGVATTNSGLQTATSTDVGAGLFKTVTDEYLLPVGSGPSDFRAIAPGYGGVYIENTANSELVDYTLLHLVTVDTLSLGDASLAPLGSAFTVTGTSPTVFTVTPLHDGTAVAGAIDLEWSVDDPSLVSLTTPNPTARMTLTPRVAGKTALHVAGIGLTATLELTVSP
jgi:hypothetical protein